VSIVRITDTNLIVADYDSSLLRQVDAATGAVTTLTPNSSLSQPYGLAVVNNLLYAHTDKNSLGAKDPSTGTIWSIDTSLGTATILGENLGRPRALAALGSSQLLAADDAHHVLNKFDLSSKVLDLVAGVKDCAGYGDGQSSKALFNGPAGVVVRSDGAYVVADAGNARIRLITTDGTVSTLAGDGVASTVDGPAQTARFVHPRAIAIDGSDNLYVSDDGAHRIRRIDKQGVVVTIAGAGNTANAFADGTGETAQFAGQEGIAVSLDGKTIYLADGTGGSEDPTQQAFHRIRVVTLP
jgi:DNA-binding beta-propeller fold protein YncE